MTFEQYQAACLRTWRGDGTIFDQLKNCAYGLGEIGEIQNLLKKWEFHGHPIDDNEMIDELGDFLFYIAIADHLLDGRVRGIDTSRHGNHMDSAFSATVEAVKCVASMQSAIYYTITAQTTNIHLDATDAIGAVHYIASMCHVSIGYVMTRNIEKLLRRYPDGFDSDKSINREG